MWLKGNLTDPVVCVIKPACLFRDFIGSCYSVGSIYVQTVQLVCMCGLQSDQNMMTIPPMYLL